MAHPLRSSQRDAWDTCLPFSLLCITSQAVAGLWMRSQEGGCSDCPSAVQSEGSARAARHFAPLCNAAQPSPFLMGSGTGHPPGLESIPTLGTSPEAQQSLPGKSLLKDQQSFTWLFKRPFQPLRSEFDPSSGKTRNKQPLLHHSKQCKNFKPISK